MFAQLTAEEKLMQPELVEPNTVARRIAALYSNYKTRRMPKCMRLTRAELRLLAGRERVEEVILRRVVNKLGDKYGLYLLPVGKDDFAVFDADSFEKFLVIAKKDIKQAIKSSDESSVDPRAAWPFPTAATP